MENLKNAKKIVLCTILSIMLLFTYTIPTMAAPSLVDTFTDEAFALSDSNKEQYVNLLGMFDSVSDKEGLKTAYSNAFGRLASAQQDRVNEFGATINAVGVFVDFCAAEDYDIDNLNNYLLNDNQAAFKSAISSRQAEFESDLSSEGVDVNTLKNGFSKMATFFDFLEAIEDSSGLVDLFDATAQYGSLTLDTVKAETLISLANAVLGDDIDGTDQVIDAFEEFVTFYNGCSSSDKTVIYNYLNNYGMIDLVDGGGGGGGAAPVEDDETPSEEEVNETADEAQDEETASEVINDSGTLTDQLAENVEDAQTEEEKQQVAESTKTMLENIIKVSGLIESEEQAENAAENISKALSNVGRIIGALGEESSTSNLVDSVGKTLDAGSDLMDRIQDPDKKKEAAKKLINGTKSIKDAAGDAGSSLDDKLADIANKAVESAGTTQSDSSQVDSNLLRQAADNAKRTKDELENEMQNAGVDPTKKIKTKIGVEVPAENDENMEATLPPLEDVLDEVDELEVKSPVADIKFNKDTFEEEDQDALQGNLRLSARKVDPNDPAVKDKLPPDTPPNTPVIDLNAFKETTNDEGQTEEKRVSDFRKPMEISIPYTPTPKDDDDSDEEFIVVCLLKDDGTVEKKGGRYNPKTGKVTFFTESFSIYFVNIIKESFNDLGNFSWAEKQVSVLASKGIINGKSEGVFDPSNTVTRAEFVSMIARIIRLTKADVNSIQFDDVKKDAWYAEAVAATTEAGIINGRTANTFAPDDTITRQEISKIISKVLEDEGYEIPENLTKVNKLDDSNDIGDWAKSYVELAYRLGILKGRTATTFVPEANATRAESAVMLYRLYNIIL